MPEKGLRYKMAGRTITFTSVSFVCPKCGKNEINLYTDLEFVELAHARRLLELNALYCKECEELEAKKLYPDEGDPDVR